MSEIKIQRLISSIASSRECRDPVIDLEQLLSFLTAFDTCWICGSLLMENLGALRSMFCRLTATSNEYASDETFGSISSISMTMASSKKTKPKLDSANNTRNKLREKTDHLLILILTIFKELCRLDIPTNDGKTTRHLLLDQKFITHMYDQMCISGPESRALHTAVVVLCCELALIQEACIDMLMVRHDRDDDREAEEEVNNIPLFILKLISAPALHHKRAALMLLTTVLSNNVSSKNLLAGIDKSALSNNAMDNNTTNTIMTTNTGNETTLNDNEGIGCWLTEVLPQLYRILFVEDYKMSHIEAAEALLQIYFHTVDTFIGKTIAYSLSSILVTISQKDSLRNLLQQNSLLSPHQSSSENNHIHRESHIRESVIEVIKYICERLLTPLIVGEENDSTSSLQDQQVLSCRSCIASLRLSGLFQSILYTLLTLNAVIDEQDKEVEIMKQQVASGQTMTNISNEMDAVLALSMFGGKRKQKTSSEKIKPKPVSNSIGSIDFLRIEELQEHIRYKKELSKTLAELLQQWISQDDEAFYMLQLFLSRYHINPAVLRLGTDSTTLYNNNEQGDLFQSNKSQETAFPETFAERNGKNNNNVEEMIDVYRTFNATDANSRSLMGFLVGTVKTMREQIDHDIRIRQRIAWVTESMDHCTRQSRQVLRIAASPTGYNQRQNRLSPCKQGLKRSIRVTKKKGTDFTSSSPTRRLSPLSSPIKREDNSSFRTRSTELPVNVEEAINYPLGHGYRILLKLFRKHNVIPKELVVSSNKKMLTSSNGHTTTTTSNDDRHSPNKKGQDSEEEEEEQKTYIADGELFRTVRRIRGTDEYKKYKHEDMDLAPTIDSSPKVDLFDKAKAKERWSLLSNSVHAQSAFKGASVANEFPFLTKTSMAELAKVKYRISGNTSLKQRDQYLFNPTLVSAVIGPEDVSGNIATTMGSVLDTTDTNKVAMSPPSHPNRSNLSHLESTSRTGRARQSIMRGSKAKRDVDDTEHRLLETKTRFGGISIRTLQALADDQNLTFVTQPVNKTVRNKLSAVNDPLIK